MCPLPTVAQWLAYWLEDVVKPARKPSTYVGYEVAVRLYLVPQLGKVKLTALKTADVRGMLNRIRQQCQCCAQGWDAKRPESKQRCCAVGRCCGWIPNPSRVHHVFRTLRAALGVAVAEEVLTRNVAGFAKPIRPRRHRFQTWSVAEATTFLSATREHRLHALFAVAIALGMRRGEALGLRSGLVFTTRCGTPIEPRVKAGSGAYRPPRCAWLPQLDSNQQPCD